MVNLTTVYGTYLSVPNINIIIPLDAGSIGLFDFSFLVGSSNIPPAYPNSQSNSITSQIVFIFSNSFAADLGTGYQTGDAVGCVPISGLTFNTIGRLTCTISLSTSPSTYPTITLTGYDLILNATTVRIRIAGLKTLPVGVQDYI
jgi:hypothetical protein